MSIETKKTAAPLSPSREQLLQQYYGNQLMHSIGAGAGVGVGATALYQLLRALKQPGKKEKKYNDPAAYGTGSPMFAKESFVPQGGGIVTDPAKLQQMQQKQQTAMANGTALQAAQKLTPKPFVPGQGSAPQQPIKTNWQPAPGQQPDTAGADGSPRFTLPQTEQNRIYAQLGNKAAFDLGQTLGGMLPKHLMPFGVPSAGGGLPSADPYAWRKAWSTAANIGGAGLGAYGGHKLVQAIVKAKKKRELAEAVEDARRSYYDALGGLDKAAALDAAYEQMKQGNALMGAGIGAGLGGLVGLMRSEKGERLKGMMAGVGAGGLAGAGIGAVAPHAAPYVQQAMDKARGLFGKMTPAAGGAAPPAAPPTPPPVPPTTGPKGPITPLPVPPAAPGGAPAAAPVPPKAPSGGTPAVVRRSVNGVPIKSDALGGTIPVAAGVAPGKPSTLPGAPAAAKSVAAPKPAAGLLDPRSAKVTALFDRARHFGGRSFLDQLGADHANAEYRKITGQNVFGWVPADSSFGGPGLRPTAPLPARARHRSVLSGSQPYMAGKTAGVLSSIYNTPQALRTAYLLSILGAGGVGAHYMYNRTKELTEGENLAKAQASRARLKGLPPVWVDPESLAQVKQLAETNE